MGHLYQPHDAEGQSKVRSARLDVAWLLFDERPAAVHHTARACHPKRGSMKQFRYLDEDGNFDYDAYRTVQTAANRRKLDSQWVDEATIRWLSDLIRTRVGQPRFGLCHGTRQGLEQAWFRTYLGCEVIGTEISDTADQFPDTIEWDFHELKPEWLDRADFIYSNSWDHSYDPVKLFTNWMRCVRPGGICLIEHCGMHLEISESDPLGMTIAEMKQFLGQISDGSWAHEELVTTAPPVLVNNVKPVRVSYHVIRKHPTRG